MVVLGLRGTLLAIRTQQKAGGRCLCRPLNQRCDGGVLGNCGCFIVRPSETPWTVSLGRKKITRVIDVLALGAFA